MSTDTLEVGDVVLVTFPFSDGKTGKRRPALVMSQRDDYGDLLLLAITSNPGTPDGVSIGNADLASGTLPAQSWVKPLKLSSVHTSRVERVLAKAAPGVLASVRAKLCPVLGCL